jgi:CMP-N-acetylneuraminic acid synthetase/spore coat polysaccharide biosynthesis predicted glycosyltransferase SpsG
MKILVIIPARGGSKGIPRKNLRYLAGKPLLSHCVSTVLNSKFSPDVFVSSEDEEILSIASKLGASTHRRDLSIANDATTLDPVIYHAFKRISCDTGHNYDLVITVQPTSPLLKTGTFDRAIQLMIDRPELDTVIAACNDTHLTWTKSLDGFKPNYHERVNRQYLNPTYKETGAFLMTRSSVISECNRIGENVDLCILDGGEEIDIDTFDDWALCEYYLLRKKILFVVSGNSQIGLGHVYNTLLIANDIVNHKISFLVDSKSTLAKEKISSKNFETHIQQRDDLFDDIISLSPDVVINDILDTELIYVEKLKKSGIKVINFEDLGEGAKSADLVINAIYPENESTNKHFYGEKYFILRDEFILSSRRKIRSNVKRILLTFGGVDPNNFTLKVLKSIYSYCQSNKIKICVAAGFGYNQYPSLSAYPDVDIYHNCNNISDLMNSSDLIFTSAGRTIYEVASLGVPAIVLAQNERETTHFFASGKNGFLNLGMGNNVSTQQILTAFRQLVEDSQRRHDMARLMRKVELRSGRQRVLSLINSELGKV